MDCRARSVAFVVSVAASCSASMAQAPAIGALGMAPGAFQVGVHSISGDGSFVVGWSLGPSSQQTAARWSVDGSAPTLLVPAPMQSARALAYACSADGSEVFGAWNSSYIFQWTEAAGFGLLQSPPGRITTGVHSVSDGGTRGVGLAGGVPGDPVPRPFLWTAQLGAQIVDVPAGYSAGQFGRISPDGGSVAGLLAVQANGDRMPALWSESAGWRVLPMIAGAHTAEANLVSSGGTVVVLRGMSEGRYVAGRWTEQEGTVTITAPAVNGDILFNGLSADGSVMVGQGALGVETEPWSTAIFWTAETGLVRLDTYLASLGVDMAGWELYSAVDVSNDGRTIVGMGMQSHPDGTQRNAAWVVTIPSPAPMAAWACLSIGFAVRRRR